MHAIRIHAFEPDNLVYEECERPTPQAGEVLIRNQAAGVNPIDWKTVSGGGACGFIEQLPYIPGWEFSGIIEACGEGVENWQPGQAVLGFIRFPHPANCYAEYLCAPADEITLRPEGVDAIQAAALGLTGLTAWQALFEAAALKAGEKVLILAAAGGVGHLAVQLAVEAGAEVTATASIQNHAFLRSLGAHTCLDYANLDWSAYRGQFDVILDGIGGDAGLQALPSLKATGRCVTLPSVTAAQIIAAAEGQDWQVMGIRARPDAQQLAGLVERLAQGRLHLAIDRSLPLTEAATAHKLSASGHCRGKLVLSVEF
ncbi:NADP-dependent oxidoreductase [Nitrincola tapanii]|uniref:NADP-dependent oxidoreductase n=1 Tax=Nitrincola tapanii TaxID=1708751 RepID=A0A5A9VZ31_9GAMM|nr:NADP-dependent oxidoreductase [Nitrincola tapanii]KAA0873736.1 NADP-dependent oxidoreductase [Nitrincola tapanii]